MALSQKGVYQHFKYSNQSSQLAWDWEVSQDMGLPVLKWEQPLENQNGFPLHGSYARRLKKNKQIK